MYNKIVKRIRKILISSLILVIVFILGFLSKDYLIKNKPPSSTPNSKVKNILFPEPKDGKYKVTEAKPKYLDRLQKAESWAKQNHDGVWLDEWIIKK